MSGDPYRDQAFPRQQALLDEEMQLLTRAGRVMVWAGLVGLLATALALASEIRGDIGWWSVGFGVGLPGLFAGLTLQAGLVLSRLSGGSRDYTQIERAVGSLGVLFQIKGILVLVFMALTAVSLVLPLLFYMVR